MEQREQDNGFCDKQEALAGAGDVLEIEYDGSIAESYPAQITNVYSISVVE